LGPLSRPADGGGRLLALAGWSDPGGELPRLARARGGGDGVAVALRPPGPGHRRPDARAVSVDLRLVGTGARGLPRPARLGGARRDRHGSGGDPVGGEAAVTALFWMVAAGSALAGLAAVHAVANVRALRRPPAAVP